MDEVLDYSTGRLTATQVRAAGYAGAVRYLRKRYASVVSVLTSAEVADYRTQGVPLALYYEDTAAGWMLGGYAVGVQVARWALDQAHAVGIAEPRCIYLCDDTQHDAAGVAAVMDCLDGARTVLGPATGLYGFRPSIRAAVASQRAHWFALTGSPPTPTEVAALRLNLYQHNYEQPTVAGVVIDVSDVLKPDWGQWPMEADMPIDATDIDTLVNSLKFRQMIRGELIAALADPTHQYLQDELAPLKASEGSVLARLDGIAAAGQVDAEAVAAALAARLDMSTVVDWTKMQDAAEVVVRKVLGSLDNPPEVPA